MKICPKCRSRYPDEYQFCPLDAVQLLRADAGPSEGKRILDRFQIGKLLRKEEWWSDYEGKYLVQGQPVRVRILEPLGTTGSSKLMSRVERECQIWSRLAHPGVQSLFDFGGLEDGRFALVLKEPEGETLSQRLERSGALPPGEALEIARQVAAALDACHRQGWGHGSLSSQRIRVGIARGSPAATLEGFITGWLGLEKLFERAGKLDGLPVKELAYFSPEQASLERPTAAEEPDEIYSLGVILYEMLAGISPFYANSGEAMIIAHTTLSPTPIRDFSPESDLSNALDACVMRLLAKTRKKRFESCHHLVEALAALPESKARTVRVPEVLELAREGLDEERVALQELDTASQERPREGRSWRRWWKYAASVSLLVILGVAGYLGYRWAKPQYGAVAVNTEPDRATVILDGQSLGLSPLNSGQIPRGSHQLKIIREGYKEYIRDLQVTGGVERLFITLQPVEEGKLSAEEKARIQVLREKMEEALNGGRVFPPPEGDNALAYANDILQIEPANSFALETKYRMAEDLQSGLETALRKKAWSNAESQIRKLMLLYPEDVHVKERLAEVQGRLAAERQQRIALLKQRTEEALGSGNLVEPEARSAWKYLSDLRGLEVEPEYVAEAQQRIQQKLKERAESLVSSQSWEAARDQYRLYLRYFPGDSAAGNRLAELERQMEAARLAQAQQRQQQQEAEARKSRASSLRQSGADAYQAGNFDRAIGELRQAIELEDSHSEAYFFLGASLVEKRRLPEAIAAFERCVQINPRYTLAYLNLGILYERVRKDYPRAIEYLTKVRELGGVGEYTSDRLTQMIGTLQAGIQSAELESSPIPAQHRHAFGSCAGFLRVSASSGNLSYETNESDHGFTARFADLRSTSMKGDRLEFRWDGKRYQFRVLNEDQAEYLRRLMAERVSS